MCHELTPMQAIGNKNGLTKHKPVFHGLRYGEWMTKYHSKPMLLTVVISLLLTAMPPHTFMSNLSLLVMWAAIIMFTRQAYSRYVEKFKLNCPKSF